MNMIFVCVGLKKNLNKNLSISYIQTTLSMMGFQISRWTESTNEYRIKKFLRPQDVTNILKNIIKSL